MSAVRLTHGQALAGMVLAPFLWSTAGVVTRQLESAERFEVTFWRSAFAGVALVLLLPVLRALDGSAQRVPANASLALRWWGISVGSRSFWLSGVCWAVMFTAFMVALTMTSVAHVLVLLAIGPLLTAVLGRVVLHQVLPLRTWLAVGVAVLGIVYMFGSQWIEAMANPAIDSARLLLGTGIALLVPLAGAINWIVVQRSQQRGQTIDLVPAVMVGGLLSAAITAPAAWPFQASLSDVTWLGALGVFQLAIPCALSVLCAKVLKAAEVSLLAQLEVLFGIGLTWALAGEEPARQVLLGGVVVMTALLVNEWLGWHDRRSTPRIQTLNSPGDRS
jgi:drug/metabolite transporter (DMT)-like permease